MWRKILNRLQGHFGIVKTLSMARTCVFWPGISKDIKEMIKKCPVCAKHQIGNAPEHEMPHEFPTSPLVKVAIDFFYFNGKNYEEKGVQNDSYYSYQKRQRDRCAVFKSHQRTLSELQPGSSVFVQNRVPQWEPEEVLCQNEIARSYRIRTYNRNRIHLRPNKCSDMAPFEIFTDYKDYSTSDTIPESTPVVRPQEPVAELASD
ncbi:hypothetical protein AVEN_53278-1 [Araneus ventricosus]|uniref:RNA-directed DNA polymerase n=1 Tax=Araneus ventricosus TaxID=182803 RepID=A0A4Y2A9K3_ARAVE|nr:hypothetical protein AVEN_53278-1 [Araneus ventricosus]